MQCEMCGESIRGVPKLIRVEGAELQVCSRCGKFGTEVQQVRRTDVQADRPAFAEHEGTGSDDDACTAETRHVRLHGR